MINKTRRNLLDTVDIPEYVLESEAYIKRHRNWIFDSPISKIQRSKSMHKRSGSVSSFVSGLETSSSSNSTVDPDDMQSQPSLIDLYYPRLQKIKDASPHVREEFGLQYMQRLADTLRISSPGKKRPLEMNYEDFFEAFEVYSRQSSVPGKKLAEESREEIAPLPPKAPKVRNEHPECGFEKRRLSKRAESSISIPKSKLNDLIRNLKAIDEDLGKK